MNFVEIEAAIGGTRHGEMAVVNRIEGAAEKRDATRMMFCGGAVRLRGGQRRLPRRNCELIFSRIACSWSQGKRIVARAARSRSSSPARQLESQLVAWQVQRSSSGCARDWEFCRAHRPWSEPGRERLRRWRRRWSGIRVALGTKSRESSSRRVSIGGGVELCGDDDHRFFDEAWAERVQLAVDHFK